MQRLIEPHEDLDKQINKWHVQVTEPESQALLLRKGLGDGGRGTRAESQKNGIGRVLGAVAPPLPTLCLCRWLPKGTVHKGRLKLRKEKSCMFSIIIFTFVFLNFIGPM